MAWINVANNQMVSYLDASTSGIPLLSGQSHFTTLPAANQCMTKTDMQSKYNLNASNLSMYGSLQLVPKSAWVSNVVYPISLDTTNYGYSTSAKYTSYIFTDYDCELGICQNDSRFVTLYSSDSPLVIGSTIYTDTVGSLFATEGSDGWYQKSGGTNPLIYYIDYNSQVTSIYTSVYESPNVPPTAPPNFSGSKSILGGTNRYIEFTWDDSTDNDMLHHYNLYYYSIGAGGGTPDQTIHIVPAVINTLGSGYIRPKNMTTYSGFPATKSVMRVSSTFFDNYGSGAPVSWWVKAVDISGNESAASNTFYLSGGSNWTTPSPVGLGQNTRKWNAMCVAPNGNVYAATELGDIYKQTAGAGNFIAQGQALLNWTDMCAAPNGDVYASVQGGDIYKQTNGTGAFVALGQASLNWNGMTAALNGDIYASVYGGDIYKQTNGTGAFVATLQTTRNWGSMQTAANGDIYATAKLSGSGTYFAIIYKKLVASSIFIDSGIGSTAENFSIAPNDDMWNCVPNGDLGKYQPLSFNGSSQRGFQTLGQIFRNWTATCVRPTATGYDVYFCGRNEDIYKYSYVN